LIPGDAFLIVASDGLWDDLTNEQAVSLVGEWIDRRASGRTAAPTSETKTEDKTDVPKFTFVDNNAATHLVRNALGGADENKLRFLMALQPPNARRFRDDITVTVVFFDPPKA
jgi:pyruvate dehydrogenase phosphatase